MNINDDDSNDLLLSDEDNLLDESSLENNSLLSENKVDELLKLMHHYLQWTRTHLI